MVVTPGSVAKILDLGLAKNLEDTQASFRTVTGAALGTPHYISPEQARGDKDVDGRSDIYSLGATFYHLVTGQAPYKGTSGALVMSMHLTAPLPDPRQFEPSLSDGLCRVLRKTMAKNPEERYADVGALDRDLQRLLGRLQIDARGRVHARLQAKIPVLHIDFDRHHAGRGVDVVGLAGDHAEVTAVID